MRTFPQMKFRDGWTGLKTGLVLLSLWLAGVPFSRGQGSFVQQPASVSGPVGGTADINFILEEYGTFATIPIFIQRVDTAITPGRFGILSQQYGTNGTGQNAVTTGAFTVAINNLTTADAGTYYFGFQQNSFSVVLSQQFTLTVVSATAPVVTTQPQSQVAAVGTSVIFGVSVSGTPPFSYQWNFNGSPIPNATNTSYTVANAQSANAGSYSVSVSNSAGTVNSTAAVLTAISPPHANGMPFGGSETLTVPVIPTGVLSYQWQFNGSNIAGATAPSYAATAPGLYTVVVSGASGSTASVSVLEFVTSRLINISSRAPVGVGGNILIPGFFISGGAGTTKQLLIRGVGPALTSYGVSGVLNQPTISLFDGSGTLVATNTGWGTNANTAQIASITSQVGAFALLSGSADCALIANLSPGAYTVQLSGVGATAGIALAEVYEVNSSDPSQLVNIGSRAQVGSGIPLISGFVVEGSQPAKLLVRADGPVLAQYGVSGALAQPVLTVFNSSGGVVATNTSWGSNSNAGLIASTSAAVGAFPLPSGSADCALLLSLQPGAYTAQVSGLNSSSGVALVEVFQSP